MTKSKFNNDTKTQNTWSLTQDSTSFCRHSGKIQYVDWVKTAHQQLTALSLRISTADYTDCQWCRSLTGPGRFLLSNSAPTLLPKYSNFRQILNSINDKRHFLFVSIFICFIAPHTFIIKVTASRSY